MKNRDLIEVLIAGLIGLVVLLGGALLLSPPRIPVEKRPVKSLRELQPPASHWYADACGQGECDD